MGSDAVLQLGVIVVAGIGAQWLAWRLRLPAIVLLLVAGFLVGPVTGVVEPDALLGPSLPAVVSLGVGLVLFEGSLSLDLHQLREARRVIVALVTVGALVTWAAATGAATVVLELPVGLALLVGAIVVVTGPTVIGPLLAQIRPTGAVGPVLRGEGIFSDAIGATLAVLVFEAVLAGEDPGAATGTVVGGVLLTLAAGTALGLLAAALLVVVLHRFLVPDFLGSAVTIAIVLGAFTLANQIQEEAGLLTVTVTGIALATQRWVSIRPIVEFSESVGVLVVSALFIVLSARLDSSDVEGIGVRALVFLAVLIVAIRPLAVGLASLGSRLDLRERAFVAGVAPRGIVAAATASVFGLRLAETGDAEAQRVTSVIFLVVVGTILVYGIGAPWLARRLDLSERSPQGVLIIGAQPWSRELAGVLVDADFPVVLADTSWENISAARLEGFTTYFGSVLSARALRRARSRGDRPTVGADVQRRAQRARCAAVRALVRSGEHVPAPPAAGRGPRRWPSRSPERPTPLRPRRDVLVPRLPLRDRSNREVDEDHRAVHDGRLPDALRRGRHAALPRRRRQAGGVRERPSARRPSGPADRGARRGCWLRFSP